MKRMAAVALMIVILLPGVAFAGSSTDAALGLGAFAVFNQILGGVEIFQPAPPPAAVVVAPPPPPPVTVYQYNYPAYYYPAPQVYYQYQYYAAPGWCPPGLAKQGRCFRRHHHDDDDD